MKGGRNDGFHERDDSDAGPVVSMHPLGPRRSCAHARYCETHPTMAIPLAIVVGQTFDLIYPWRPDWLQPSMLVSCKKCNRDPVSGTTPTINWGNWSRPAFAQGEDCKLGHNFTGGEDGQCCSAGCSA